MSNRNVITENSFVPVTAEELRELYGQYKKDLQHKYHCLDKYLNEQIRRRTANGYGVYAENFEHHPFVDFSSKEFENLVETFRDRGFSLNIYENSNVLEIIWAHLL